MSGFAGVFHFDGAPVDQNWLATMADFLSVRGPDGTQIWSSGSAGLCHTLLRTRVEHDNRPQIASLDGKFFLAGDVRIDDRETLVVKLPDPAKLQASSSAQLLLHAYAKWGEGCLEHLLGDFSFVIWDAERRQVFSARDQLGVRPFFYAQVGQCLLVSNTLDCIRQIPIVPPDLNDQAIGDFLLAGENKNPATTFFSAIHRLPVAHSLGAAAAGIRIQKYWTLPVDESVYYKNKRDYVDRYNELLRDAVSDRLPDGPLGILMSGGLDSPSVAAAAVQLGAKVTAFTSVYDRLIPDEERYYAGLVAKHLRIPIHYDVRDDDQWGWEPGALPIHTPEPLSDPTGLPALRKTLREMSTNTRVFFFGDGPDAALLYEWKAYASWLRRERKWSRLGRDFLTDFVARPRFPLLHRLPQMWRERSKNQPDWYHPSLPDGINLDFRERLRLDQRMEEIRKPALSPHPIRPEAYDSFECSAPMGGVEGSDAGFNGVTADFLHPLWDLRLLRFLLAVPVMPWCRDKYLIREALRGVLPEVVRTRPKTPLAGLPYLLRARSAAKPELPEDSRLAHFIDLGRMPPWPGRNREETDWSLRVLGLHYWLVGLYFAPTGHFIHSHLPGE